MAKPALGKGLNQLMSGNRLFASLPRPKAPPKKSHRSISVAGSTRLFPRVPLSRHPRLQTAFFFLPGSSLLPIFYCSRSLSRFALMPSGHCNPERSYSRSRPAASGRSWQSREFLRRGIIHNFAKVVNEHADEYGVTGNDSVLQGSQSGPRETSRVWLLFGTLLAVLALRLTPDNLRFSSEPEPATTLLSSYIIDTEFLTRVALQHKT
jgi:hypothetical protein